MPLRAAVWDLGSSSFHLLVCEAGSGGSLEPVLRRRALLNLGMSVGEKGEIPADRAAAAVAAARRLRGQLDGLRPDVSVALATAALRDATNGPEVVERLERVLDLPVRVLDGAEEARLCFVGQRAGVWMPPGQAMGVDLGGGSVELAVGDARELSLAVSVPVGATRLRGELRTGDPLSADEVAAVRRHTDGALRPLLTRIADCGPVTGRVVLSGGTARALARLATVRTRRRSAGQGDVNQVELARPQVEEIAAQLAPLSLADRLGLPGMPARRAPVLPIGALILATMADTLDVDRFVVSEWGLREGAILDALVGS